MALGVLLVTALVSVGVYITFVNPAYRPDLDRSVAATRDCVDESAVLEEDAQATKQFSQDLGYGGRALGIKHQRARAIAFFFPTNADGQRAGEELSDLLREGAAERGITIYEEPSP